MELMQHQLEAIANLKNGSILWGGVGSGKSATVLGYYVENESPKDIYVITTAKKRDSLDWLGEASWFGIGMDVSCHGKITIDSWNNIGRYEGVKNAFFVFDEQRVVGHGSWVRSFISISKNNNWVLLSATPGDTWLDYAPVFIANGFYRNITDFRLQHVVLEPFSRFPRVRGYIGERKLELLQNEVLVEMPYLGKSKRVVNYLDVGHDKDAFARVWKDRWHIFEDRPVKDIAELFRVGRRVVNSDPSRVEQLRDLMKIHDKIIVFYNFNYELEILREFAGEIPVAEWNGHRKQQIPNTDKWLYLVQYVSGAEGWNCTDTDAMVFFSLTYSYKNFEQAQGRIDRLDTPFETLYYYVFVSNSYVDKAVLRSLKGKKTFNEKRDARKLGISFPDAA